MNSALSKIDRQILWLNRVIVTFSRHHHCSADLCTGSFFYGPSYFDQ